MVTFNVSDWIVELHNHLADGVTDIGPVKNGDVISSTSESNRNAPMTAPRGRFL